eukprot:m.52429 g.52429  ORF g.52429 m.52429 type:complete len:55 (-) comp13502_c0_seq2:121-285(-)
MRQQQRQYRKERWPETPCPSSEELERCQGCKTQACATILETSSTPLSPLSLKKG